MKIAIHQPNYLPWTGYFYKMSKSDVFVLLDNVQYERDSFSNRVKIKNPKGESWLTVAVNRKFPQLVREAEIADFKSDKDKHLKTIEMNYKKARYFDYLFPDIEKVFDKDWKYLSGLNIELIKLMKDKLGIKTKIEAASDYNVSGKGTDLLIGLCKNFKGDAYLSGKGGAKYQDEEKFEKAGIKLEYTDFSSPEYPQLWGDFVPNLSIIDLIFNCGPESLKILTKK